MEKDICEAIEILAEAEGFNRVDTKFGRQMAELLSEGKLLTPGMVSALRQLLPKYRGQLREMGFELDLEKEVPTREPLSLDEIPRRIGLAGDFIVISFPYDPDLVSRVKSLPQRKWEPARKRWVIPLTVENFLLATEALPELVVTSTLQQRVSKMVEEQQEVVSASRAEDADIEVPDLGGELFPFQKAGVSYAVKAKRCFIADEMGLGKTVQALATVQATSSFPALIVCPASLKLNWEREARKWLPGRTVRVLNGRNKKQQDASLSESEDVIIINYDILSKWKERLAGVSFKAVVLDESHYCKNYKAKRTEACKELAKGVPIRLALTGTPVLNRPQELLSQLGILGRLNDLGGFWHFAKRYCQAHQSRWGWDFSGAAHLDELNQKMRACCFVRRRKEDVLKELPSKQRAVVPVAITNTREYRKAEKETVRWLAEQAAEDKKFLKEIADLPEEEQKRRKAARAEEAAQKARQAEQLVRIEALKQVSAQGKLEPVEEWVESFLETGEKLVIFAHHREIVEVLAERFDAPSITGQTSVEDRQAAVDRFQSDPDCQVIICNLQAGGVGITLTAASNVCFVELGWTPAVHDQAEDRCHRIGQEDQVTAWYLVGEGTIEEDISDLIERKRQVVDAVTEGDVGSQSQQVLSDLVERMIGKGE